MLTQPTNAHLTPTPLRPDPVTVVTGCAPYDVAPARFWAAHGQFLTWAEGRHGSVVRAVEALNGVPVTIITGVGCS